MQQVVAADFEEIGFYTYRSTIKHFKRFVLSAIEEISTKREYLMTLEGKPPAQCIIGIGSASEHQVALLVSGPGRPEDVFEAFLGRCLRGEISGLEDIEIAWVNRHLYKGDQLRFAEVQTGVAQDDLDFFLNHWRQQFSTLLAYPPDAKKPSATSDAGLRIDERLKET